MKTPKPVRSESYMLRISPAEAETLKAVAKHQCTSGAAILRLGLKRMAEEVGITPAMEKQSDGTTCQARAAAQ